MLPHLFLEMIQLGLDRCVELGPPELVLEELAVHVRLGPDPARRFEVIPRGPLVGGLARAGAVLDPAPFGSHLREVGLCQPQFLALHFDLTRQQGDPFAMPRDELLGHLHRLAIGDLGRESPPAFGV